MTWRAGLRAAGVAALGGGWITITVARLLHTWARDNDLFAEQYARRTPPGGSRTTASAARPAVVTLTHPSEVPHFA